MLVNDVLVNDMLVNDMLGERVALLVGSERTGLSDGALRAASVRVRIPMSAGVDSLNVAAATAVACWHLRPRGGST